MAARNNTPRRKEENVRRANRVIQQRTTVLMLILGVLAFLPLIWKLYSLQITRHTELQSKAVDQQTRNVTVSANRGTIYDQNDNIMAISATAETIFLSPKEINEALNDPKKNYTWTKTSLAEALGSILDLEPANILKRMEKLSSQYEIIKLRADKELSDQVRAYINENKVVGVYLVTDAKRYYPYGSLCAQVIGFVGDENTGLYGLEARYEEELEGQTGLVITAKDNAGNDMPYEYEQYFDAKNGDSLVLTIDTTVQYYLEKGIQEMCEKFSPANGATGIIMNAKDGAVLAMASYPNYDLNDFSTVTDKTLLSRINSKGGDEAAAGEDRFTLADAQLTQWRNKCLNDTYEPGSTFKILTLAAALEEGVVDKNTTVFCSGYIGVSDATIHCSNAAGHGQQTLIQTVGHSCNPAFVTYGLKLGTETYYKYLRSFGLMNTTGIDLGGEAVGVFAAQSDFTQLDLACYAFGQNFTVTPIGLISAQAACINGGYLYTPYLVSRVTDGSGNTVWQHDATPVRQVISEETSATVRECLEYVVSDGTGKNGQVSGYRIGGKTGTADKGKTGDVVVSFLCFAPADDPQIIMLITMDTPSRKTGVYVSGGNMVAPTASRVMADVLPYLGIEPTYSADELLGMDATVPNVIGMTVEEAKARLKERGFTCKVVGDETTVSDQTPVGGALIPGKSAVILYCGQEKAEDLCTVPDLLGRSPSEANTVCTNNGLLIRFSGTTSSDSGTIRVLSQSEEAGSKVAPGTVITVQLGDTSVRD